MFPAPLASVLFFFNDTATTEIYTLSLHDALPISDRRADAGDLCGQFYEPVQRRAGEPPGLGRVAPASPLSSRARRGGLRLRTGIQSCPCEEVPRTGPESDTAARQTSSS